MIVVEEVIMVKAQPVSRVDDPIIGAMVQALVETWDPIKIILFGSRARRYARG